MAEQLEMFGNPGPGPGPVTGYQSASVWDPRCPWASIAHALQFWPGVPQVVSVPGDPPARSFSVDGAVVEIRQADDILGVVCWGYQEVDPDIKTIWLARARRGEP